MYLLEQCLTADMFGRLQVEIHRWYYDHELQKLVFVIIPVPRQYFLVPTTQENYNPYKLMSYEMNCSCALNGTLAIQRNWPVSTAEKNFSQAIDPGLLKRLAEAEIFWLDAIEICAACLALVVFCIHVKCVLLYVEMLTDQTYLAETVFEESEGRELVALLLPCVRLQCERFGVRAPSGTRIFEFV
jgi:hypothetical protein